MKEPKFPEDLPQLGFKVPGGWIPVLLEPLEEVSKGGIHLVNSEFDEHTAAGMAWVLGVPKTFMYLPPSKMTGEGRVMDRDLFTHEYEPEVKRGDKILFRRWERTSAKALGCPLPKEELEKYPGYEAYFIHHDSILAIITEE